MIPTFVVLTLVTTVGPGWIIRTFMVLVASGMRAITTAMQPSMTECTARALTAARILSRLMPSGICCSDRRHPDGVIVVLWKKLMIWDATCPDMFVPSYLSVTSSEAGAVAAMTEERKKVKCSNLDSCYSFVPMAIETSACYADYDTPFIGALCSLVNQASNIYMTALTYKLIAI